MKKLTEWVEMQVLFFAVCGDQSSPNLVDTYNCSFKRRFPIDDILFQSGDIRDQIAKSEILMFFWPPNFLGLGTPKFLTQFKKLQSPSNMWQSLVTIGPETSEIR